VKIVECGREQDVLDALAVERWPERVPEELRAHVAQCALCADLVAAVRPILADRVDLSSEGHIPSSGAMWWRAQMRARQEAAREAARPITVAHTVGFICALAIVGVAIAWLSPVMRDWLLDWTATTSASLRQTDFRVALPSLSWPVLLMGLVWLLLAPLAIYFVMAED
jgi:hypothetical protein